MRPDPEKRTTSFPELTADAERLHFAIQAAGVGVWEYHPASGEVYWDERCRELFGLSKEHRVSYLDAMIYVHADDREKVTNAVIAALRGVDNGRYDIRYRTIGADDGKLRWVHFTGQAYFDTNGAATRFAGVAHDITDYTEALLESENSLMRSESRYRAVVSSAPAGIGVFVGRDLLIEMPNQVFIEIVGKGPDIEGKPLREVMPELHNQPFLDILANVFETGEPFRSYDTPVNILRDGQLHTSFFNVIFSPLFDEAGKVYAILDISVEVTESMEARKNLVEAKNTLQDAVELAKLATWIIHPQTGHVEYSERMQSWLGVNEPGRAVATGLSLLAPAERERVRDALLWALKPESGGMFDLEYGIVNQLTGLERVIHSQGRTMFDENGKPVRVTGVAQDVTAQRNLQLTLENEVQQRTEELDAANEELKVTNEELQLINEQLATLNEKLEESNENLQRFAHVASHDLKEPVRKIRTFLSLIEVDPGNQITEKSRALLKRVYAASDRIYSMINGVLAYSIISAAEQSTEKVDLNRVMYQIIDDLEVMMSQKGASVFYGDLPVVEGAEVLLSQLFSNLIINSLKFSKPDTPPVIKISSNIIEDNDVIYAKILVADNGVGFSNHQSEQIFNMFSRLHSKDKYEGTGLGLSLCRKIVSRHHGTIDATAVVGQGATFTIKLPVEQPEHIV